MSETPDRGAAVAADGVERRRDYPPHQRGMWPHSMMASFTCPVCVKRCYDAGQDAVLQGREFIRVRRAEWEASDGVE